MVDGGISQHRRCDTKIETVSRFGSKAALTPKKRDFWSAPNNGHRQTGPACPNSGRNTSTPCHGCLKTRLKTVCEGIKCPDCVSLKGRSVHKGKRSWL